VTDLEAAFRTHRRELHVHCYRMLASYDEAEDAVQEAYLRAWKGRAGFDGTNVRAWLYAIATNVCIDAARRRARSRTEVSWLTPYPDAVLDGAGRAGPTSRQQSHFPDARCPQSGFADTAAGPDALAVARETIELAFLAALQVLPPRQRAALLAREVLGLPAAETAVLLDTTVAAANSALQRARATMREHLPSHREDWAAAREPNPAEKELLERFIDAHERCDAAAALSVAAQDIRVTMPPAPMCFDGRDALKPLLERAFGADRDGDWRLRPTAVNRMPAAASYLRRPGDSVFRGFKLDVLRVEGTGHRARIAEITTFGWSWFARCGLPEVLDGG
jgi:RNA polymerase sigma-70 factor (ECF subfamily)